MDRASRLRVEPVAPPAPSPAAWTWQRWFLAAAGLSLVASVSAWFLVDRDVGLFVGLWVPSILGLGSLLAADRRDGR